jgi:Arc/MetJ-type ribon-helix-helix transcriptional regulator
MIFYHTRVATLGGRLMSATKIAITLDAELLRKVDLLVAERRFPTRSRAIQEAVKATVERLERGRLARESAKLDPRFEQQLAEQGLAEDLTAWPSY